MPRPEDRYLSRRPSTLWRRCASLKYSRSSCVGGAPIARRDRHRTLGAGHSLGPECSIPRWPASRRRFHRAERRRSPRAPRWHTRARSFACDAGPLDALTPLSMEATPSPRYRLGHPPTEFEELVIAEPRPAMEQARILRGALDQRILPVIVSEHVRMIRDDKPAHLRRVIGMPKREKPKKPGTRTTTSGACTDAPPRRTTSDLEMSRPSTCTAPCARSSPAPW